MDMLSTCSNRSILGEETARVRKSSDETRTRAHEVENQFSQTRNEFHPTVAHGPAASACPTLRTHHDLSSARTLSTVTFSKSLVVVARVLPRKGEIRSANSSRSPASTDSDRHEKSLDVEQRRISITSSSSSSSLFFVHSEQHVLFNSNTSIHDHSHIGSANASIDRPARFIDLTLRRATATLPQ